MTEAQAIVAESIQRYEQMRARVNELREQGREFEHRAAGPDGYAILVYRRSIDPASRAAWSVDHMTRFHGWTMNQVDSLNTGGFGGIDDIHTEEHNLYELRDVELLIPHTHDTSDFVRVALSCTHYSDQLKETILGVIEMASLEAHHWGGKGPA